MRKLLVMLLGLGLAGVLLASSCSAGVPSVMTYQGKLTNTAGQPVADGAYNMKFSFWDAATAGNQLWLEPASGTVSVQVKGGLFNVRLGSTVPLTETHLPGDTWLETEVNGTAMTSRVKLASSAYAIRAKLAESVADDAITSAKIADATIADADISASAEIAPSKILGTAWTAGNDGTGSGLDADLLDGMQASAFALSLHDHDAAYVNEGQGDSILSAMIADGTIVNADISDSAAIAPSKISGTAWTGTNDGSDSGLDADLLDGQQASAFAASAHGHDATYVNEGQAGSISSAMITDGAVSSADIADGTIANADISATAAIAPSKISGTAWTGTNDGAGTGLDADLLDGQQASAFAGASHNHNSSYWSMTGNSGTNPTTNFIGTTDNQAFEIKANGFRTLRIEPSSWSTHPPNIIGGHSSNYASSGMVGVFIGGGGASSAPNRVTSEWGVACGGIDNEARYRAFVGGGETNLASGGFSVVAGGAMNWATEYGAAVGGGDHNVASNQGASISGGESNSAGGWNAAVGGGNGNSAGGMYSTVPGGASNTASGRASFAAGQRAKALHEGTFVWADSAAADLQSTNVNQFVARAGGGFWFGNSGTVSIPSGRLINTSTGAYLSTGGTWTNNSDRGLKENFTDANSREVLAKLIRMPISTWSYRAEDSSVRHMGPTAQDFAAAFGLGNGDKNIATIDADGVAMAAIQGLHQMVQEKDAKIKAQDSKILKLEARLQKLEKLVTSMTEQESVR